MEITMKVENVMEVKIEEMEAMVKVVVLVKMVMEIEMEVE